MFSPIWIGYELQKIIKNQFELNWISVNIQIRLNYSIFFRFESEPYMEWS